MKFYYYIYYTTLMIIYCSIFSGASTRQNGSQIRLITYLLRFVCLRVSFTHIITRSTHEIPWKCVDVIILMWQSSASLRQPARIIKNLPCLRIFAGPKTKSPGKVIPTHRPNLTRRLPTRRPGVRRASPCHFLGTCGSTSVKVLRNPPGAGEKRLCVAFRVSAW